SNAQTQIDVIEGDRKALVEATHLLEHRAAQHQTGARDAREVLHRPQSSPHAGVIAGKETVRMAARAPRAEDHAAMLYRAVGIEQPGADDADLLAQRVFQHPLQPVGVEYFHVVVEK